MLRMRYYRIKCLKFTLVYNIEVVVIPNKAWVGVVLGLKVVVMVHRLSRHIYGLVTCLSGHFFINQFAATTYVLVYYHYTDVIFKFCSDDVCRRYAFNSKSIGNKQNIVSLENSILNFQNNQQSNEMDSEW